MKHSEIGWELWRGFLAIAGHGSLSAAAREVGLTQPTVGRHLDALEAALGHRLFTRSQAGLSPTPTAMALVPHARAMAASAEALARTASAEADEESGTVRLTVSEVIGMEVLPPILADFGARHPAIAVEVALSNRNEDMLRREAEIAIRMVRPVQQALLARRVGRVAIGLYAHRDYLDRRGRPATPDAIFSSHALIGPDRDASRYHGFQIAGRAMARDMFTMRVDNDVAQLQLLRAGCGIGVCQLGVAARDPDLVRLFPDEIEFGLDMWLAMHEDLRGLRRVRLLFDYLAAGLGAYVALPDRK
ncbi:MAG: LysR family transcriptional regulator [Rhizobiaceae bacterium]|nr:LysR family transcriptional regulator [Rhizobiaceae bacterium]MCV0406539.1 LysR family transcriptional regulator [Rhizobiaceae bacterium]